MVSVCTVPARGGRSCEHFGGYKTINRIPLPLPQEEDFRGIQVPSSGCQARLLSATCTVRERERLIKGCVLNSMTKQEWSSDNLCYVGMLKMK